MTLRPFTFRAVLIGSLVVLAPALAGCPAPTAGTGAKPASAPSGKSAGDDKTDAPKEPPHIPGK
jgi:hypothetical protein